MSPLTRRAAAALLLGGCLAVTATVRAAQDPRVKLATSAGDIVVELYPDKAPKTVANFLQYVRDKHYDGTIFHRVIDNFMIQGGGFDSNMTERPNRPPVQHEGRFAYEHGLKNVRGTIAMARTSDPNSATSEFFINVKDNAFLDPSPANPGYTVFGRVVSGMDVVDRIKGVQTATRGMYQNVPVVPVVINSATVLP